MIDNSKSKSNQFSPSKSSAVSPSKTSGHPLKSGNKWEELRESLAELEHKQWCQWAFDIMVEERISDKRGIRWLRLIDAPYSELTEAQKDQDRKWADKVLKLLVLKDCLSLIRREYE